MKILILIAFCVLLSNCEGYKNLKAVKGEYMYLGKTSTPAYLFEETTQEVDDVNDVQIEVTGISDNETIEHAYMYFLKVDYIPTILRKFPELSVFCAQDAGEIELKENLFQGTNITELFINYNTYPVIKDYTFKGAQQLKKLQLQNNGIQEISEHAFATLDNLEEIYLSRNKIWALKKGTFALPSLKILYITGNKLTSLKSHAFEGAYNLKELALYENDIKAISSKAFYGIGNLKELYFSENQINFFKPGTFDQLRKLEALALFNNSLTILTDDIFSSCKNMKKLYLSDNKLTAVSPKTFSHFKQLETLKMAKNLCYEGVKGNMDISALSTELEECFGNYKLLKEAIIQESKGEMVNELEE